MHSLRKCAKYEYTTTYIFVSFVSKSKSNTSASIVWFSCIELIDGWFDGCLPDWLLSCDDFDEFDECDEDVDNIFDCVDCVDCIDCVGCVDCVDVKSTKGLT